MQKKLASTDKKSSSLVKIKSIYDTGDTERRLGMLLAAVIVVLLLAWVLTGTLDIRSAESDTGSGQDTSVAEASDVRYVVSKSVLRNQTITRTGSTYPSGRVELVAERSGRVISQNSKEGTFVKKGDLLYRLDARDLEAQKSKLAADRKRLRIQQKSNKKLAEQGLQSELGSAASDANIAAIKTQISLLELQFENSEIRAPVAGFLESATFDVGSFARVGTPAATILVLDPLGVNIFLSQSEIALLEQGTGAASAAVTIGNKTYNGKVSRISADADPRTRSFEVDIEIPNKDYNLRSGLTASVDVSFSPVHYHALKPSWLLLSENGDLAIKYIDDNGRVQVTKINVGNSEAETIWVSGLPEEVKIVTLGQEKAIVGETVDVALDERY